MARRCLYSILAAALVIVIVVSVTVPLVLKRNKSHSSLLPLAPTNVSIILPLYIYPSAGAWDPLYSKLKDHTFSGIHWTIIINPFNGPGDKLDTNYNTELNRLSKFANVDKVGYVFTNYGRRPIEELAPEIEKYASWGFLNGIFFDETPQGNTTVDDPVAYLTRATDIVRGQQKLSGNQSIVIHNPGTPLVKPELLNLGQNITIIIEDTLEAYQGSVDQQAISQIMRNTTRDDLGAMLHSVSGNLDQDGSYSGLLSSLSQDFKFVYLTERTSEYYHAFGDIFNDFVNATSVMLG